MSNTVKQNPQQEKPASQRRPKKKWTLVQQLERIETQIRLWQYRKRRQALRTDEDTAEAAQPLRGQKASVQPAQPEKTAAKQPVSPRRSALEAAEAAPTARTTPERKKQPVPAAAKAAPERKEQSAPTAAKPPRQQSPAASGGFLQFSRLWRRRAKRAQRRWRHIRREQAAHRFPESDRLPVQLALLVGGMVPMLGCRIRESVWGRKKRSAHRYGAVRAWFEHRHVHPAAFLGVAGVVACIALFFSFYTFGTTVTYQGEVVAKVSSKLAAKNAAKDLEDVTRRTLGGQYTLGEDSLHYSTALMARSDVVDGETFEEELSSEIGLVTYGYSLYVDGEMLGATPYKGALEELLQQLQNSVSDENTISCSFQEDVQVKAGYVPTEKIMNLGYLAEMLYSTKTEEVTYTVKGGDTWSEIAESHGMTSAELLEKNPGYNINKLAIGEVLTMSAAVPYLTLTVTQRESYVTQVPYEIEYTDSANLYKGDYKVLSAGKFGSADVVANVTYVNGEETERKVLSYVTLVNPVTEQQARGTKERPTWLPTGTFRWPVSGNITSRFGYRRSPGGIGSTNHKGIDIANRKGTPVCAADGGTVIYAGWMSGYGYLVQIDHGNGYVTYYGHNSSLTVSVGQHVYKGQQVARMGSTGNSTGNHCHFEVRYNGVPKNPLNYLP